MKRKLEDLASRIKSRIKGINFDDLIEKAMCVVMAIIFTIATLGGIVWLLDIIGWLGHARA